LATAALDVAMALKPACSKTLALAASHTLPINKGNWNGATGKTLQISSCQCCYDL